MEDFLALAPQLAIGVIQIGVAVFLVTQTVKALKFVADADGTAKVAAISAFVFAGLHLLANLEPASLPYVTASLEAVLGACAAVLGYVYAVAPVAARFGVRVSTDELS